MYENVEIMNSQEIKNLYTQQKHVHGISIPYFYEVSEFQEFYKLFPKFE